MHHLRNFYPLTFLIQISPTDIFISSYHGQTFHNKPIYVWWVHVEFCGSLRVLGQQLKLQEG